MSYVVPSIEPTVIRAGETISWTKYLADYLPAAGWALAYRFSDSAGYLAVTASNNGDGSHLAAMTAANTTALAPSTGEYREVPWVAVVTHETEIHQVGSGRVRVYPAMTAAYDARSHAKKMLDAIEATLAGRATKDQEAISLPDGRSISRTPFPDLLAARAKYQREYQTELDREGISQGRGRRRPKVRL